jgi:hypothetical protein
MKAKRSSRKREHSLNDKSKKRSVLGKWKMSTSPPKEICWDPTIYSRKQNKIKLKTKVKTVTPQNRHLTNYSNHATIRTMSLWKCTTKQNKHVATYTLCGWNQGSNIAQVHDETHKRIYSTTAKTPTSQEYKYIKRSKSYIKQIVSEYGQEYK